MNAEMIDLYRGIQDRRGELWAEYDKIFCEECGSYDTAISHMNNTNCKGPFIWIAPVWDEDCPERCLWAMVDWKKWGICVDENRRILIHERKYDIVYFEADTLPEALLRAAGKEG